MPIAGAGDRQPAASVPEGVGPATVPAPVLRVRDLTVHHGQLRAVSALDLDVRAGEIYAVIGANGAGKSTLLRTLAGLHRSTAGRVELDGEDISKLAPERRLRMGIALVPEGRRLFGSLTVHENLVVGAHARRPGDWTIERVYELFGWMRDRRRQPASQLSGGEQQAVAIGRALVANPRILLLDELSLGLSPAVVRQTYAVLPELLATRMAILLVEQDVSQVLRVATRVHCLLEGRTTLQGSPADFSPTQIEAAYFGLGATNGTAGTPGMPGDHGGPR